MRCNVIFKDGRILMGISNIKEIVELLKSMSDSVDSIELHDVMDNKVIHLKCKYFDHKITDTVWKRD